MGDCIGDGSMMGKLASYLRLGSESYGEKAGLN